MASVYAFHPRQCDYPHLVAEDDEALADKLGSFIGGEQCDECGNSVYLVIQKGRGEYYAKCADDPSDDRELAHPKPCGTEYRIRWYDESEVTF